MDMDKFIAELFSREELNDIPIDLVCRVAISILEIVREGKCFYEMDRI